MSGEVSGEVSGGEGELWEALAAAGRVLSARDGQLAEADLLLAATLQSAHRLAVASIQRIEEVRDEIDAASGHPAESPAAATEFARLLAAKHRQVVDVISQASADAKLKTAELQRLSDFYQITA